MNGNYLNRWEEIGIDVLKNSSIFEIIRGDSKKYF